MENSEEECSFVWDEASQLYYHARTGFYHDPNAGWYYSSQDGLYYKFENGTYMPLESSMIDESLVHQSGEITLETLHAPESCSLISRNDNDNKLSVQEDESKDCEAEGHLPKEMSSGKDQMNDDASENPHPPPPSEWLEDTLIELYLSGYSHQTGDTGDDVAVPVDTFSSRENNDEYELEEGEWIPEDDFVPYDSVEDALDEGAGPSQEEENWLAQYGQVIQPMEQPFLDIPCTDLWDWAMVSGLQKAGKGCISRLVGRQVKRSVKLHPSVPPGGGLLKTAPICEASLDLVRVKTGQVYKLRTPSRKYLASLSSYDSSNPTRDWGFPGLSLGGQSLSSGSTGNRGSKGADEEDANKELSAKPDPSLAAQHRSHGYRDRAAERRTLHGGYGVGPGQKGSVLGDDASSSLSPVSREEAAAEALNNTFGAGSYARKVLESMGWKEGDALGSSVKGLVKPIQAVGNIGNAGLGWPGGRTKQC